MIITGTPSIEGKRITEYLGVIGANEPLTLNLGGKGHKKAWNTSFTNLQNELIAQATALGADAIVCFNAGSYKPDSIDVIYATGTAVKFE